jgi:hypothetical protein
MAHTSPAILGASRAVSTVATALVVSTIASAAVITGIRAVIDGETATSKNYSSYWTAVTLKGSGKLVPIKRVVRASSDELATTRSARARDHLGTLSVTCGFENVPPVGPVCPVDWRLFPVGLRAFELDLGSAAGRGIMKSGNVR